MARRQREGRFQFTFTPKHGSWLNLIEGFFSKLAAPFCATSAWLPNKNSRTASWLPSMTLIDAQSSTHGPTGSKTPLEIIRRRRQPKLAQSNRWKTGPGSPSKAPGSKCCVSRRQRRPRSIHSDCVGCLIEPRNIYAAGAEAVSKVERNMCNADSARRCHLPGSKNTSRAKGVHRKLGDPASGQGQCSQSGPHREDEES